MRKRRVSCVQNYTHTYVHTYTLSRVDISESEYGWNGNEYRVLLRCQDRSGKLYHPVKGTIQPPPSPCEWCAVVYDMCSAMGWLDSSDRRSTARSLTCVNMLYGFVLNSADKC